MTTTDETDTSYRAPQREAGSVFSNPDPSWLPDAEVGIPRDEKERPLIVPPGGTEPVPYERMSRVPSYVDSLQWLLRWKLGLLAKGLSRPGSEDLVELASAQDWDTPQMAEVIETALDRGGANRKANYGTAVHAHAEHLDDGQATLADVPARMRYDVASYQLACEEAGLHVLESEVFVVYDELRVAGTIDKLAWHEALGLHVGDIKTGKFHAQSCAVQTAIGAHSRRVDPDLVRARQESPRYELAHGLALPDGATSEVNLERAVIAHVPMQGGATTLKRVDIARGWELAQLAMAVREHQDYPSWCDPEPLGKATRGQTITASINAARSRAELREVMEHCARWATAKHRELANTRWSELGMG